MQIQNIEIVFECGQFTIHELLMRSGAVQHRTAVPSTVGLILHDPVNDYLALTESCDMSTLNTAPQLPEVEYQSMESSYNVAKRYCASIGIEPKSVTFVQTLVSDHQHSSKQVSLMYVVVDSRGIPEGTFTEATGSELIRQLGKQEPLGAPLAVAAHYLKLVRLRKA